MRIERSMRIGQYDRTIRSDPRRCCSFAAFVAFVGPDVAADRSTAVATAAGVNIIVDPDHRFRCCSFAAVVAAINSKLV